MTIWDDEQSDKLIHAKNEASHPQPKHIQQRVGKKATLLNIAELEALPKQEIQMIIQKQHNYQTELEMQNEKLRRTIEKMKALQKRSTDRYNLAPIGYVTIGEQGIILEANTTFSTLIGSANGALINDTVTRFIIKEDQDFYFLFQKKLFETGKSNCELRLNTADSGSFWVCLMGKISLDKKIGKSIGLITVIDINKYRQVEEKLRGSKDNLCRILDNSPVVIYSKDLSGKYTIINKKFEELSGLTKKEVIHRTDFDLFPESVAIQSTENDRKVIESAAPAETEETAPVHGEMRTFLSTKYPLMDSGDKMYGICGFSMDIEKRKQTEKALENAKTKWEETFDAITDWVCIIDQEYRVVCSNKASEKYFGLLPQELVGKRCHEIVHGTNSPIFDCPLQKAVKKRQREEFEFQTENGLWWHVLVNPIESIKSNDKLTVHVVRDITDSKIREQKVLVARKAEAFRILAGGLAHDFNNLLTVIWGNISVLKNEITGENLHEFIKKAENACELARSLTQKFITLSISKGAVINKSKYDIKKVLSTAAQISLKTRDIRIFFDYPSVLPMMELDLEQMFIVFQNIIVNAAEAMPNGGNLNIKTRIVSTRHNNQKDIKILEISFKDTGAGISESDLPKVFDPYFTTKAMGVQKGVGLGLAASHAIVTRHGGNIFIDSGVGRGTTVIVSLPFEQLSP